MGRFSNFFTKERIPEWRDYYINFLFLKDILQKIKRFRHKGTLMLQNEFIASMKKEEMDYIVLLKNQFEEQFI